VIKERGKKDDPRRKEGRREGRLKKIEEG